MCAESRFAEPRSSLRRGRFYVLFASCKKNQKARQRFANLWTPGTIQSSAGSEFAKLSGGSCRNRVCPQNAGVKALNRCERVTVVQTQDRYFSKMDYCTASLQRQVLFKKGCCTFVWVLWEVEFWFADSRFAEPRIFLKKVLIVAVRSCHCGALIRGLQNLDAPCEGERVVTFCIVQKVTKKHAGRSPATHDSNRRSIRCFCESDRRSSGNRLC